MNAKKTIEGVFFLTGKDFANVGVASSELKAILEKMGIDHDIVRRAAIASFEAEMNVIIYTPAGMMRYKITPDHIKVIVEDIGPGIEDIELAMTEGYSTAPDYIREMGFGSGMGLPNIKKNTNELKISSKLGAGTTREFVINIKKE
ncbi:MAG: anti-sigma regulatory factor [Nitrospirae bacterium]|nr:anti-sigma regulatory factor [Nitrospirota bacterium]